MRLTCPNCGAQYEVPDEVIPQAGRDVQCSNCGNTWFQAHPDSANTDDALAMDERAPDADADTAEPEPEPASEAPQPVPETAPEAEQPAASAPRNLDPAIADILREEARHEVELRAAENKAGLESQPDLGLDAVGEDASSRRAREARDRMARMRGEAPAQTAEAPAEAGSRRELLPDIEEINSSLRVSHDGASAQTVVAPVADGRPARRRGGFTRGFGLAVIVIGGLTLIYANATAIAQALPPIAPLLSAYAALVDQARVWLDGQVGQISPK